MKERSCRGCGGRLYGPASLCGRCAIDKLKARGPKRKRLRRRKGAPRNPAHLDWIRSLPCAVSGCMEPSEAAHVRQNTGAGMGLKPPDEWCAPLCHLHHMEQHQVGHRAFDEKYGVDLRTTSQELAEQSPYTVRKTPDESLPSVGNGP